MGGLLTDGGGYAYRPIAKRPLRERRCPYPPNYRNIASGLKGIYNHQNQEIKIEGLKEGEYELLILAIKGNLLDDGATIHPLKQKTDQWISFPSDLQKPLEAEYFYSKRQPRGRCRRS